MRKIPFVNDEYFHIYNRGTDKRQIFMDKMDIWRFIKSILVFNRVEISKGIRNELGENNQSRTLVNEFDYKELIELSGGLVEIVCLCLNPNHYHLLVKQVSDDGISKFMQRLGTGYTNYFNERNKRNGVLFQGKFKAVHIKTNEQLLYLSAYINLNDKIHGIGEEYKEVVFSSWSEYLGKNKVFNMCKGKDIILDQSGGISEYEKFAKSVLEGSKELKEEIKIGDYLE